jgi:predicted secreted protein
MANPVIGKDCVLAYGAITSWDSPSFTAIPNAVDVSMPGITKTSIDLPSRGSQGWNLKGAGLKTLDLTFGYLYHSDDAVFAALRAAFLADTVLMFAVLDGPSAGVEGRDVQGFRFPGIVMEMPMTEELEDGRRVEFKVEAARYVDSGGDLLLPEWYTIDAVTP